MLKNIIYFLVLSFLFSACNNKILLVKRTYSKGYYLSIAKPKNKLSTCINKRNPTSIPQLGAFMASNIVCNLDSNSVEKPLKQSFLQIIKNEPQHSRIKGDQKKVASINNNKFEVSTDFKPLAENQLLKAKKETAKRDGKGARKFWMAILCLFPIICLIPVYLHDEKKVTMNFWLTLILHFTLLGYVIFALLIVFNLVDLR